MKYLAALALLIIFGGVAYWQFGMTDLPEEGENVVYETEVDSAADCAPMETYDEDRKLCTFECSDEAQCKEYESYVAGAFEDLSDEYTKDGGKKISEAAPKKEAVEGETTYTVSSDESITPVTGTDDAQNHTIWNQIAALAPDDFSSKYIEEYKVFDAPSDDTLAYVSDDYGNGKWTVAVNLAGYNSSTERERTITLVHELSHIVTLNSTQVTTGGEESTCDGFFTGEGCAKPNSYIGAFVSTFWSQEDLAAVGGGAGEGDAKVYERKPSDFVTEYASTNPGEDIAESFALFVIDPKNDNPQTAADKKTQFFYQFPALVTFRNEMRTAITRGIVRARSAQGE